MPKPNPIDDRVITTTTTLSSKEILERISSSSSGVLPTPGSDGDVLTVDGGEWTSAAPAFTLEGFVTSFNDGTPNDTIPASQLLADGVEDDIDVVVSPKGAGALLASLPDDTATGGNKRGPYAVDHQLERAEADDVAGGGRSTIGGGAGNEIATSANFATISGGRLNVVSSVDSAIGGGNTNEIKSHSTLSYIGGGNNNIIGDGSTDSYGSVIVGGENNTLIGIDSTILGGNQLTLEGNNAVGFLGANSGGMHYIGDDVVILGNVDLAIGNNDNATRGIKLYEAYNSSGEFPDTANCVTIKAPDTLAADYTLTLPTTDGASGQVLSTDGSGGMGWVDNEQSLPISEIVHLSSGSSAITAGAFMRTGTWMGILDTANAILYTSQDGTTWNERAVGATITSGGGACTSDFGVIVVSRSNAGGAFRRSTDFGVSFSDITNPTGTTAIAQIYCAGTTFIGLRSGTAAEIARSTDSGATFNTVAVTSGSYTSIAGDGAGVWVIAVGGSTTALRSIDDGATWSAATLPFVPASSGKLTYFGGKFWLNSASTTYASSTSGDTGTWTTYNVGFPFGATGQINWGVLENGNYVYTIIGSTSLAKINITNGLDIIAKPVIGVCPSPGSGGLMYFGSALYCIGNTSNGGSLQIFKISNLP